MMVRFFLLMVGVVCLPRVRLRPLTVARLPRRAGRSLSCCEPGAPDGPEARTRQWIEEVVISLGLCPFAARPYMNEEIRYVVRCMDA